LSNWKAALVLADVIVMAHNPDRAAQAADDLLHRLATLSSGAACSIVLGASRCLPKAAEVTCAPVLVGNATMGETTEDAVLLEHITKIYAGVERSVRDTMHNKR